ncbi:MAG: GNAT family N-acetyltransferase [Anaerolineae bacterium]
MPDGQPTTVQVRILTAEDYDAVRALWEAAGLHIRPQGRDSREGFAAQIASGCQTVIGLEADGQLVGVALATTDSRRGWINRVAVHPDWRRRGLGLRLIAECERVLRDELGLYVLAAHIETDNPASMALFEKAGYHRHDEVIYFSKRDSQEV